VISHTGALKIRFLFKDLQSTIHRLTQELTQELTHYSLWITLHRVPKEGAPRPIDITQQAIGLGDAQD
jgi:hypothetical protein